MSSVLFLGLCDWTEFALEACLQVEPFVDWLSCLIAEAFDLGLLVLLFRFFALLLGRVLAVETAIEWSYINI